MRQLLLLLVTGLALAGCASVQRTLTYPATLADADIWVGGHEFSAWFHETDPTLLLQRGPPQQMGRALAQNWTLYAGDQSEPTAYWRAAADAVLQPIGCQTVDITGQDQMREITYRCMDGVDAHREVAARREQWRAGVRIDEPRLR